MNVDIAALLAIVLGSNVVTAIITGLFNKRGMDTKIDDSITERWKKLADEYQDENAKLRERLDSFEKTVTRIRDFYDTEIKRLEEKYQAAENTFNERIESLEKVVEVQAVTIENLHADNLKHQLQLTINTRQMRAQGIEPLIDPERAASISLEELKLITEAQINSENRRDAIRRARNE